MSDHPRITPRGVALFVLFAAGPAAIAYWQFAKEMHPAPKILDFRLDPPTVYPGERATLRWNVANAESLVIQPGIGSVALSGSRTVSISSATTYTLIATNANASTTVDLSVSPAEPPTPVVHIAAEPNPQLRGEKVVLRWSTKDADSTFITELGEVPPSGSHEVTATESRRYEIRASNRYRKTASDRVTVSVEEWPLPIVSLRVNPNPVVRGNPVTVSWESKFATQLTVTPIGPVSLVGTTSLQVDKSLSVAARAEGPGGSQAVEVFVEAVAPPLPTLAIYPPERTSQVANPQMARQVSDDLLNRLMAPHFQPVTPPSAARPGLDASRNAPAPDYVSSVHRASRVSRGGVITKESVEVTARVSIVRRADGVVVWTGAGTARKSTKDLGKFLGIIDPRFSGSGLQSDVQRLEYQALSEALEKALQRIADFRPRPGGAMY